MRCQSNPLDGDCAALGFRCIEFTSSSMADDLFSSYISSNLILSQRAEGLRRQEENRIYYRYYMTFKWLSKV